LVDGYGCYFFFFFFRPLGAAAAKKDERFIRGSLTPVFVFVTLMLNRPEQPRGNSEARWLLDSPLFVRPRAAQARASFPLLFFEQFLLPPKSSFFLVSFRGQPRNS